MAAVVVISDTSPIRALHHLNLLHLLRDLYQAVIVPESVATELLTPISTSPAISLAVYHWIQVRAPRRTPLEAGLSLNLDRGETDAILLSLELQADLLLIDERRGTRSAKDLGLTTLGILGVLLEAKRAGHVQHVLPLVDRLRENLRFFISPVLRRQLAELADEQG